MKKILIPFFIIVLLITLGATTTQQLIPFAINLNGRLISSLDASKIISASESGGALHNFSILTNLEYTDSGIRSVRGMSTVTTNALTSHPHSENIYQFIKSIPSEEHILVQSYNDSGTESVLLRYSTSTPNTGTFTTEILHTDASGAGTGRFSSAPIGHLVYCNEVETLVWGGLENNPGQFIIYDGTDFSKSMTWQKDYTDKILNTLTDSDNIATLKRNSNGDVTALLVTRLPIQGIKCYVETANTRAGTATVQYWDGSTLTAVSGLNDETSSGGITLAQTGSLKFNSTANTARVRIYDNIYGYFYRLLFEDATDTTTICQITIDEPFQKLTDFWDGEEKPILSFLHEDSNGFKDFSTNVLKNEFSYDNSTKFDQATYANLVNTLFTTSEFLYLGFDERMMGFRIKFINAKTNTAATVMTVSYWDGENWQAVSSLQDGTSLSGKSFTQDGFVTWLPKLENVEFKNRLNGQEEAFRYRISFSANLAMADGLYPYYISGIPVQKQISNYKFSLQSQDSLWLFNDIASAGNKVIKSAKDTINVFNGKQVLEMFIGNDSGLVAAISIYTRTTSGASEEILVFKNDSAFIISGNGEPEEFEIIQITDRIGCNAPLTLQTSSIGLEFAPLQSKQIVIWQGNGGIYAWDNNSIFLISASIGNYFDQIKPEAINLDRQHLSRGFFRVYDDNHYYHWLFSSKATSTNHLDTELIFDLKRQGWFKVERGSKLIQNGTQVIATSTGSLYGYAMVDDGHMYRLDNGTTWGGESITSTFETADIPLSGNLMTETMLRFLRLFTIAKSTTTNNVSVTHYVDGKTTGEQFNMSPARAGYRLAIPIAGRNQYGTLHRFRASMTTNNEDRGFEPLAIGGFMREWREVTN